MKSTYRFFLAVVLVSAGLFLAVPAAFAHAHPKVMAPAADSVGPSPAVVSITFSEALEPKFSSIEVTDAGGKKKFNTASSIPVPNDPKTLTLALPKLPPGGYEVHWVSVATDGHRLEGEYAFTVK
jgi:methionine-rich copper-binding protein CopC